MSRLSVNLNFLLPDETSGVGLGGHALSVQRLHRDVTIDLKVRVAPEGEVIVGHLTPEQEAEIAKQGEESENNE